MFEPAVAQIVTPLRAGAVHRPTTSKRQDDVNIQFLRFEDRRMR
jgi:hypothetical protein